MSDITDILMCDRLHGRDAAAVHQSMLDELNTEAANAGWPGVKVTNYRFARSSGRILIETEPGPAPATLDMLKTVSKARRDA